VSLREKDPTDILVLADLLRWYFRRVVWDAASVSVIQAVPPEYSGISSSVYLMFVLTGQSCPESSPRQKCLKAHLRLIYVHRVHSGAAIGAPMQAAFYTAAGNDLADWRGSQYGFYFVIGCIASVWGSVLIWLPATRPAKDELESPAGTPQSETQSLALASNATVVIEKVKRCDSHV
jgi:hypothetical protein